MYFPNCTVAILVFDKAGSTGNKNCSLKLNIVTIHRMTTRNNLCPVQTDCYFRFPIKNPKGNNNVCRSSQDSTTYTK